MWFVIDSLARVVNFSGVESHEDEVSNMNLQAKVRTLGKEKINLSPALDLFLFAKKLNIVLSRGLN